MTRPIGGQRDENVDVIIAGGGPVGLATAYLLGRQGLRVALVERRSESQVQPKGQGVNAASMELYAQWGVKERILEHAWPFERSNGQGLFETLATGEIAGFKKFDGDYEGYRAFYGQFSAQTPRSIPAFAYERGLREAALTWPTVQLHFSHEVTDVSQDSDSVSILARQVEGSGLLAISGRYLVAADGANSVVRRALGVEEIKGPDFHQQIVTEFHADLDRYLGDVCYFHIFISHPKYVGWFGAKQPHTGLFRYNFANPDKRAYTHDEIVARIRGAIGDPEMPIEVVRSVGYSYSTAITKDWRVGRVFFVGDSAHRHSVWGGYGANLGLQEANNIGWKLAAVVKGEADDPLLDSYVAERRSRALYIIKMTSYSTIKIQNVMEVEQFCTDDRSAGGDFIREQWAEMRAPLQRATGIEFGTIYGSGAVVSDGTTPPVSPVGEYRPSSSPGARMPHVWLGTRDGQRLSTHELLRGNFLLLVAGDPEPWRVAAEDGPRTDIHGIGDGQSLVAADERWDALFPLAPGGALLVRPDGFVAARFPRLPVDVGATLLETLDVILARFRQSPQTVPGQKPTRISAVHAELRS